MRTRVGTILFLIIISFGSIRRMKEITFVVYICILTLWVLYASVILSEVGTSPKVHCKDHGHRYNFPETIWQDSGFYLHLLLVCKSSLYNNVIFNEGKKSRKMKNSLELEIVSGRTPFCCYFPWCFAVGWYGTVFDSRCQSIRQGCIHEVRIPWNSIIPYTGRMKGIYLRFM